MKGKIAKISLETALLIATANAKGIDLTIWFNERHNGGKRETEEFNDKLRGLAATMGIDQDEETIAELESAVSPASLAAIYKLCGLEVDSIGPLFIDVPLFLRLALKAGDDLLNGIEDDTREGTYTFEEMIQTDNKLKEQKSNKEELPPQNTSIGPVLSEDHNEVVITATDFISGLTPSRTASNVTSGPPSSNKLLSLQAASPGPIETTKLPFSPYDEEVAFDPNDEEDVDSNYLPRKARPTSAKNIRSRQPAKPQANTNGEVDWDHENRKFLSHSNEFESAGQLKRSSSAGPARRGPQHALSGDFQSGLSTRRQHPTLSHSVGVTDLRGRSASAGRRRNSFNGLPVSNRGTSPHNPSSMSTMSHGKSSVAKLNEMKDLVEDMVRSTVKKTDLYHLMQVNLGFIDDYMMVPPRGAIVVTKHREYLTNRELQIAFLAGRLCLTDPQLAILRSLVVAFSKQFDTLYAKKAEIVEIKPDNNPLQEVKVIDSVAELKTKPVLSSNHCLHSEWLKRYLLHLRLTKKTVPATINTADAIASQGNEAIAPSEGISPAAGGKDGKTPVLWKEWLGTKLKEEVERAPLKPKEFEKALEGANHTLCKEDLEKLLKQYKILPAERLNEEIEFRIKAWLMDIDGRRDFQHVLNVKIRNWIWNEWKKKGSDKCPKDEQGYRNIYDKLPEEQKKELRASLTTILTNQKRQELLTAERTKNEITRELYWKFDIARKDRPTSWVNWLEDHMRQFDYTLKKFRKDGQKRQEYVNKVKEQRKTVAGLNDVETQLDRVRLANVLDTHHQMELQKGIVALRRTAESKGLAKGTVITKADFDTHIKRILIPHIKLDPAGSNKVIGDDSPSVVTPVNPQEQQLIDGITGLFHTEMGDAVGRVLDVEKIKEEENRKVYNEWLAKKRQDREEAAQKKLAAEEEEKKQKEAKLKKASKVYDKWLKMSLRNKYKSRIDKKYHEIPPPKKIVHQSTFRVEKDLQALYAEKEKHF